jgi:eukaryotic-like serine/threonine-protein kinase
MELRSLGKYTLVEPVEVESRSCRFYLARDEDEPDGGPPLYLAKLLDLRRGPDAPRARGQFEHEVRLLKSLNHASVPTLHAAGEQDGIPYMVMDHVVGVDLATMLGWRDSASASRALPKELAVYVMGQLADALRHMHTLEYMEAGEPTPLGVVHRDLAPQNVMLSKNGDVVLCDFGSALSAWLPAEHDDPMAGDLAYMAPERLAEGGQASVATDLFALAVMLWEMLRGERCLARPSDAETRAEIMRFDIAQSGRRVTGLSAKLSEIVRRNLDRDPNRRYPDAYKMLQRLAQTPEAQFAERARAQLGQLVAETVPSV